MPNHVYNTVSVSGSAEDVAYFYKRATLDAPQSREFSYWNFITPPAEAIASGEYWGNNGFVGGERVGDTPNNWYRFNIREWGTKWDAYDVEVSYKENATKLHAQFCSAWSPPLAVFEAMVEQHPKLAFCFSWEEEQGWGGEAVGLEGNYTVVKEWDIPDSHADYVHLDREDSCICASEDDQSEWYKDCPREVPEHSCDCPNHQNIQKETTNG